jgi:hypothetical protein
MLKRDMVSEDTKIELGELAKDNTVSLEEFKHFCREVIMMGVSNESKKQSFIRDIDKARSKDYAAYPVYNYLLAGEGKKSL